MKIALKKDLLKIQGSNFLRAKRPKEKIWTEPIPLLFVIGISKKD